MSEESLGKEMRSIRKSMGLTQSQLGDKLNISNRYVSQIENGAAIPTRTAMLIRAQLDALQGRAKPATMIYDSSEIGITPSSPALKAAVELVERVTQGGGREVDTRHYSSAVRFRRLIDTEAYLAIVEYADMQRNRRGLVPLSAAHMSAEDFELGSRKLRTIAAEMRVISNTFERESCLRQPVDDHPNKCTEDLVRFLALDLQWHLTTLKLAGLGYATSSYLRVFVAINSRDGVKRLLSQESLKRISSIHCATTTALTEGNKDCALALLDSHDLLFLEFHDKQDHLSSAILTAIAASNERLRFKGFSVRHIDHFLGALSNGLYLWIGRLDEFCVYRSQHSEASNSKEAPDGSPLRSLDSFVKAVSSAILNHTFVVFAVVADTKSDTFIGSLHQKFDALLVHLKLQLPLGAQNVLSRVCLVVVESPAVQQPPNLIGTTEVLFGGSKRFSLVFPAPHDYLPPAAAMGAGVSQCRVDQSILQLLSCLEERFTGATGASVDSTAGPLTMTGDVDESNRETRSALLSVLSRIRLMRELYDIINP